MADGRRARLALFACTCAALLGAAVFFTLAPHADQDPATRSTTAAAEAGSGAASAAPPDAPRRTIDLAARQAAAEDLPPAGAVPAALVTELSAVRRAAGRFLAAFFRYEVGELRPGLRRRLVATTTQDFGAELLDSAPRPTATEPIPARARLESLQVSILGELEPPAAIVQGIAVRAGRREPFSFRFEHPGRAWLAAGPGE